MSDNTITDYQLTDLIRITAESTSAFIRGDIRRYLTLIKHADDYTLFTPFGGHPVRGFDNSDDHIAAMERYFQGGEAHFELLQTYTSGNLAILVGIERQHGKVGDLPEQNWSLRVTLVFRLEAGTWYQVHRHADPIVPPQTLEQIGLIARGEVPDSTKSP